jgi:hypothetical protein
MQTGHHNLAAEISEKLRITPEEGPTAKPGRHAHENQSATPFPKTMGKEMGKVDDLGFGLGCLLACNLLI